MKNAYNETDFTTSPFVIGDKTAQIVGILSSILNNNKQYAAEGNTKNNLTNGSNMLTKYQEVYTTISNDTEYPDNHDSAITALLNAKTLTEINNAINTLHGIFPLPEVSVNVPEDAMPNDEFNMIGTDGIYSSESEGACTYESSDSYVAQVEKDGKLHTYRPGEATITIKQAAETGKFSAINTSFTIIVNAPDNFIFTDTKSYTIADGNSQVYEFDGSPASVSFTINTTAVVTASRAKIVLQQSSDGTSWSDVWSLDNLLAGERNINNVSLNPDTRKIKFNFTGGLSSTGSVKNVKIREYDGESVVFGNQQDVTANANGGCKIQENSVSHSNAYGAISVTSSDENFTIAYSGGATSINGGYGIKSANDFSVMFAPKNASDYRTYTTTITVADTKNTYDSYTVTVNYQQPVISLDESEISYETTSERNKNVLTRSFTHRNFIGKVKVELEPAQGSEGVFELNWTDPTEDENSFTAAGITKDFSLDFNTTVGGTYSATVKITAGTVTESYVVTATYNKETHAVESTKTLALENGANIATLYLPYKAAIPETAKAYTGVLNNEKNTLVLTKIDGNVIPAETAVVISVEEGTTPAFAKTEETPAEIGANDLRGVLVNTPVSEISGGVVYTLGIGIETGVPGFYEYNGTTLGAYKAYLPIPAASTAKTFKVAFATPTGIETIGSEAVKSNAPAYNLSGQRVNASTKGIVIINGHKVLNK